MCETQEPVVKWPNLAGIYTGSNSLDAEQPLWYEAENFRVQAVRIIESLRIHPKDAVRNWGRPWVSQRLGTL